MAKLALVPHVVSQVEVAAAAAAAPAHFGRRCRNHAIGVADARLLGGQAASDVIRDVIAFDSKLELCRRLGSARFGSGS